MNFDEVKFTTIIIIMIDIILWPEQYNKKDTHTWACWVLTKGIKFSERVLSN